MKTLGIMDRHTKEVSAQSYIATNEFYNYFYSYIVTNGPSPQFKKVGSLQPVPGANASKCPAGRILRENGKKLYPGVHSGISIFMVGVFDSESLLSGYINLNEAVFAPFSGEKPLFLEDRSKGDNTIPLGAPVYTQGHVYAGSDIVSVNGQVRSNNVTALEADSSGNILLDISLGQVFTLTVTGNMNLMTINEAPGGKVYLKITGSGAGLLSFGTNIIGLGPLTTANTKIYMVSFVSDGFNLCEVSRTPAYSDVV